jgi:hypothetical protein
MSAPLEIDFEARITAEVRKLGPLRKTNYDVSRVAATIERVAIEVFGEVLGRPMVATAEQCEAAAKFVIVEHLTRQ